MKNLPVGGNFNAAVTYLNKDFANTTVRGVSTPTKLGNGWYTPPVDGTVLYTSNKLLTATTIVPRTCWVKTLPSDASGTIPKKHYITVLEGIPPKKDGWADYADIAGCTIREGKEAPTLHMPAPKFGKYAGKPVRDMSVVQEQVGEAYPKKILAGDDYNRGIVVLDAQFEHTTKKESVPMAWGLILRNAVGVQVFSGAEILGRLVVKAVDKQGVGLPHGDKIDPIYSPLAPCDLVLRLWDTDKQPAKTDYLMSAQVPYVGKALSVLLHALFVGNVDVVDSMLAPVSGASVFRPMVTYGYRYDDTHFDFQRGVKLTFPTSSTNLIKVDGSLFTGSHGVAPSDLWLVFPYDNMDSTVSFNGEDMMLANKAVDSAMPMLGDGRKAWTPYEYAKKAVSGALFAHADVSGKVQLDAGSRHMHHDSSHTAIQYSTEQASAPYPELILDRFRMYRTEGASPLERFPIPNITVTQIDLLVLDAAGYDTVAGTKGYWIGEYAMGGAAAQGTDAQGYTVWFVDGMYDENLTSAMDYWESQRAQFVTGAKPTCFPEAMAMGSGRRVPARMIERWRITVPEQELIYTGVGRFPEQWQPTGTGTEYSYIVEQDYGNDNGTVAFTGGRWQDELMWTSFPVAEYTQKYTPVAVVDYREMWGNHIPAVYTQNMIPFHMADSTSYDLAAASRSNQVTATPSLQKAVQELMRTSEVRYVARRPMYLKTTGATGRMQVATNTTYKAPAIMFPTIVAELPPVFDYGIARTGTSAPFSGLFASHSIAFTNTTTRDVQCKDPLGARRWHSR